MQDITLVAGGATDADNGEGGGTDNCDGGTADNGDGGAADTKHHHVARKQLQENDWLKWEDGPEGGLFCTICQKHAKHIEINPKVMGAMVTRGCRNGRKFAEIVLSHSRSDWHQKSMKLEGETFLENWMRGKNAASEEEKASKKRAVEVVISAIHFLSRTGCPHQQLGKRLVDWFYSLENGGMTRKEGYGAYCSHRSVAEIVSCCAVHYRKKMVAVICSYLTSSGDDQAAIPGFACPGARPCPHPVGAVCRHGVARRRPGAVQHSQCRVAGNPSSGVRCYLRHTGPPVRTGRDPPREPVGILQRLGQASTRGWD